MKSKILNILIAITAIGAIGFALYPTVANLINQLDTNETRVVYNKVVQSVDTTRLDQMWEDVKEFNEQIALSSGISELNDQRKEEYESLLNAGNDGIIGYVDIPSQNIHLAIYHGTSSEVLEKGVGHLEGSSLPTDGESVHSILTGHTGLPNLDLFTDIRDMEVGDEFSVSVLNRVLTYKVDNINVILPEELNLLGVTKGENYCTLVTCTPYGINDHRLLVRGKLVDIEETGTTEETQKSSVFDTVNTAGFDLIRIGSIGLIVIILILIIIFAVKAWKDRQY